MTPTSRLTCDCGDVELVVARAEADPPGRPIGARRLADQRGHVCALDRTQVVDDSLRVGLGRADVGEVAPQQIRDDKAAAVVDLRPLERAREQLQLRELDGLVHAPEDAVDVGARLDQLGGKTQRLRARVRVLKAARVGDEGDVESLGDLRRELHLELREEVAQHLPRRGGVGDDQVELAET